MVCTYVCMYNTYIHTYCLYVTVSVSVMYVYPLYTYDTGPACMIIKVLIYVQVYIVSALTNV